MRILLILVCLTTTVAFAADLPSVPNGSIARKKELLFSDDFQGAQLDPRWHQVIETFTVENGALKGAQTRFGDKPHAAVYGLDLPTRDSVIEVKIRFEGNTMMDVEFDDRNFQGSHYGHLCSAQVRLDSVTILDQRDGSQSNALIELKKDAERNKAQIDRLYATHTASFPASLEAGKWYTLVVETIGDAMRVTIDGRPAAFFKSPGIGHETKSKIELGVAGNYGLYDDIKIWNAESVSSPAVVGKGSQPGGQKLRILSEEGPNVQAWVTAPLYQSAPDDIYQKMAHLQQDLLDEKEDNVRQNPALADAYAKASGLCAQFKLALDARRAAIDSAGGPPPPLTSQLTNYRRDNLTWPMWAEERDERHERHGWIVRHQGQVDKWTQVAKELGTRLDRFYVEFRQHYRESLHARE